MKLVRFSHSDTIRYGQIEGDTIRVLDGSFLENGTQTDEVVPLNDVEILAPVEPRNVIAIGLNYADHAKESGMEVPSEPFVFLKAPGTIIGPGEPVQLVDQYHRNDYEAEIVIVIGKEAHRVDESDAMDYVLGYTCGNDISDRTFQMNDKQWTRAKACDTYGPLGPFITDEIDPHNVRIRTRLNGQTVQDSCTDQMIFKVPTLIAHITKYITLHPGDVVFTGTPPGIGPMKNGDVVEVEIDGIGVLKNPVEVLQ